MTDFNPQPILGKIVLFKAKVPNCNEVINIAESASWVPNSTYIPDRYETQIDISELQPTTGDTLYKIIQDYATMHGYSSHNINAIINSLDVSKYLEGSYVGNHRDEGILEDTGESTLILYLNDDYEGGSLVLTESGIEIKPEAGDVILLPCHHEHYTTPTKNGIKYVSLIKINYK